MHSAEVLYVIQAYNTLHSPPVAYPSPAAPAFIWFVVMFNCWLATALSHDKFCFVFFLPPNSTAKTIWQRPPPSWLSCAPSPPTISHCLGLLLVGCCVPPYSGSHWSLRPHCSLYFNFLLAQFAAPNNGWTSSPHVPTQLHLLFNAPPPPCHCRRQPRVGCCIPPLSGSHPRLVLHPSLIFLMGAILAPQSRESAAASVNPAARRLQ